jgi:hypothetical protein
MTQCNGLLFVTAVAADGVGAFEGVETIVSAGLWLPALTLPETKFVVAAAAAAAAFFLSALLTTTLFWLRWAPSKTSAYPGQVWPRRVQFAQAGFDWSH